MITKTRAIVLSALKYQDKNLIVKCFTESDGIKSYFVRSAFSNSRSGQKIAYFQPLSLIEIEASHKNKGTLEHFREVRTAVALHSIASDVHKSTMALFLSEMLAHAIREEEKNEALFDFLFTSIEWLEHHHEIANFHLVLLVQMTKFLGFYPDIESSGVFFDLLHGQFTDAPGPENLPENETQYLQQLLGLRFADGNGHFNVVARRALLRALVDYYALHLDGFRKPKSLEVLWGIF